MRVKICVPITGKHKNTILEQARRIGATSADVAEWRYDLAADAFAEQDGGAEELTLFLEKLKQEIGGKELLFTVRTKAQGGQFPYTKEAYEAVLLQAVLSGTLEFADIEDSTDAESFRRISAAARERKVRTIASYHNFRETPALDVLLRKFRELAATGADILKCAYMPVEAADVARLLEATALFRKEDGGKHPLITMSMGELGMVSRISGEIFGSDYTFASAGETSAPGQLPIDTVQWMMQALAPAEEIRLSL